MFLFVFSVRWVQFIDHDLFWKCSFFWDLLSHECCLSLSEFCLPNSCPGLAKHLMYSVSNITQEIYIINITMLYKHIVYIILCCKGINSTWKRSLMRADFSWSSTEMAWLFAPTSSVNSLRSNFRLYCQLRKSKLLIFRGLPQLS